MQQSTRLTSLEICAGGGGQAIGVEQAGFTHLALVENQPIACETLKRNRPYWNIITKDVRDFDPKRDANISYVDLIAGGIPCTPYSIAGNQRGADDERDLLPEALRLVKTLRPGAVMLENAKELKLSSKFKDTLSFLHEELERFGYETTSTVLDAQNFGVSQRRRRTVVVAIRRDAATKKFSWPMGNWELPPTVGEALLPSMRSRGWPGADDWARRANGIAPTIVGGSENHGGGDLGPHRAKMEWGTMAVNGDSTAPEVPGPDFVLRDGIGRGGWKGYPKLTPEQAATLQGFPSQWEFAGSRTRRYKQIGNAFPPPVAYAVASAIADALSAIPADEAA
ncbi:DNA cytosine methyltransferase [Streptomyces sp. WG-D5]